MRYARHVLEFGVGLYCPAIIFGNSPFLKGEGRVLTNKVPWSSGVHVSMRKWPWSRAVTHQRVVSYGPRTSMSHTDTRHDPNPRLQAEVARLQLQLAAVAK
jgi:hypothetical protein